MISAFGVEHGDTIAKADRRQTERAAVVAGSTAGGAGVGYGAFLGGGNAAARINSRQARKKWKDRHTKKLKAHKKAHGLPSSDHKAFVAAPREVKDAFFRSYPQDLPGARVHRVLARTHGAAKWGGRNSWVASGVGAASAGGAAAYSTRKKQVSKADTEMAVALSKAKDRKKRKEASGSAIAGAGAVTAATGAVGGGVPGFKSDSETIRNVRQGGWRQRTGAALSSGRGGVFGYRTDAHQGALNRFQADEKKYAGTDTSRSNMFLRGRGSGKIKPEVDIIRHLKGARRASHVALAGGTAATAYGVQRARDQKKVSKAQKDTERYHGALLGTGSTAAAASIGGEKVLRGQSRKWAQREAASRQAAAKIIPNMNPKISDNEVVRDKRVLAGKSKAQAEAAGRHRGAAAQQRYFSQVYGHTAGTARKIRNPALATAAVGAGGLMLAGKKEKKR